MSMRVLVVDDEPDVAESLGMLFDSIGVESRIETQPQKVEAHIDDFEPHIVLSDLRMPKLDGRRLLERIKKKPFPPKVVLMSAYGSLDTATDALSWGADDFVSKPLDIDTLQRLVQSLNQDHTAPNTVNSAAAAKDARFGAMIGQSPAMRNVFQVIERIAQFPTTVLVCGESGVGKELAAREIHQRSKRQDGPFVPVNCGAIPETLLESELFGYKKGAFTGADQDRAGLIREADGGTLFLDEIGDLPLMLQVKLLRVIQEGHVQPLGAARPVSIDVRWITATLTDLEQAVAAGRFRQDLYFRINVLRLDLPSLRQRSGDLALLTSNILDQLNRRYEKNISGMEAEAFQLLDQHAWPGNVRELENVLERAYILTDTAMITAEGIQGLVSSRREIQDLPVGNYASLSIKKETRRLEIELIAQALKETEGNRTHAAKLLEISHRALLYKLKDYEIS